MVIAKSLKSLYERDKAKFKALVALDQSSPIGKEELSFALHDLAGRSYYCFNDTVLMPLERLAETERYLGWIRSGLSPETVKMFCEQGDAILTQGLTKNKGAIKIGLIFAELQERANMVIPIDLLYNLLAVQFIREDENPHVFSQDIQREKVDALKKLAETGNFFFGRKELKLLQNYLNMSEDEWNRYWQSSKLVHEARDKAISQVLGSPL